MEDDFDIPTAGKFNETDGEDAIGDDMDAPEGGAGGKVGEEKEIGKDGLNKKILNEGDGWDTPINGDEVEVHYVGSLLDGTRFDSSLDRELPFKFKLGLGHVIQGWDDGIKTMKKGEKSLFTIPPALAYGESGSPPTIPPNATLQFEIELLSWTKVKDISKDGCILKTIVTEGQNWQTPKDPDEVLVKYEVRLEDGSLVSKSEEVEFTVKDGCFCPALSKAVKTMKKGEKALFTVKPQYGFGENGRDPSGGDECVVPPNTTIQITVELVSWKIVSEVTTDKKVLKKILKEGEGYDRPNDGAIVQVKLVGKLEDGTVFVNKGHNETPFEFKIDEEQVIDGIDRSVKTMKKGEVAVLTIHPEYGFGSIESHQESAIIPANSNVYYDIELISFEKEKDTWELSTQEKIETSGRKKEEGNTLFKRQKYERASKRYEKALSFVEYDSTFSDDEKQESKILKISCNLNNAACKLKLKDYKQTVKLCTKVLDADSKNVKALYRRAQAYIQLVDLDLAEMDIRKALEIDPKNRDVKLEYKLLKEKVKEHNKKDAQFYGNIFAKMNKLEHLQSSNGARKQETVPMTIDSKA
ncbi:70 kDa peptidyl-prolyl isomerase [Lactuca sativa]|uniref:70 kDa peptidyl-prolyl isomerase n=1 Tax=Lactuca sativa TaxID=4236 RepID=UPI000CD7E951|nr:70 kDa peptidyl-prolyl isomerase [Lactuca sativa]